jgi:SAM-dependent methyltransferase
MENQHQDSPSTHAGHGHGHGHGSAQAPWQADDAVLIELLDLDAEVLHVYHQEVIDWIGQLAAGLAVRRIVDIGSGTGTGTFALARRFPAAEVTALDVSAGFLSRIRDRAHDLGLTDRIHPLEADLDNGWPKIDDVDLVWASASLHHLADPDRVLADIFGALRPGALLTVSELDSFPQFLPDDIGFGRPGLEARAHAMLRGGLATELPELGSDWAARISQAGFKVEAERQFTIDLTPPLPASTGRYAQATLSRMHPGLGDRLEADDLAALDRLTSDDDSAGVLHRDDLTVRAARTVWVAGRP